MSGQANNPAMERMIFPASLRRGDCIAIVSPSGKVKGEFVDGAAEALTEAGFDVRIYPHAKGGYGTFSGTADQRYADLSDAFTDPDVRAILCARGGYGAIHLLERLDSLPLRDNPKWIIGYSDISALHALMQRHGIASIHAPMAKHITTRGLDDPNVVSLLDILGGQSVSYTFDAHPLNQPGEATAPIVGGNLAVLMGLLGTPYDIIRPGTILFIEDVSEPVYKVERALYQLHLSGALAGLKGLVVGQFTEYSPDVNHESMEQMISDITRRYGYPVIFGAPIGHVDNNVPVVEGGIATIRSDGSKASLRIRPLGAIPVPTTVNDRPL